MATGGEGMYNMSFAGQKHSLSYNYVLSGAIPVCNELLQLSGSTTEYRAI